MGRLTTGHGGGGKGEWTPWRAPSNTDPIFRQHIVGKAVAGAGEAQVRRGFPVPRPCLGLQWSPFSSTWNHCRCPSCSQAPGQATTPTGRALSTSASGTSYSVGSGAPRTRAGSGSDLGPPRPASWAPITCAKVRLATGLVHSQGLAPLPPGASLALQAAEQVWSS